MPDYWLKFHTTISYYMKRYREQDDLGTATPNANYGAPSFGVGDYSDPGPTPDSALLADTASAMSTEDDPGFSLGGANDPLAEYTSIEEISDELSDNTDSSIVSSMNYQTDDEISMNEDELTYDANGNVISDFSVQEDDDDDDDEEVSYDSVDEMPEFEEYDELDVAEEEVDGLGIIEPEVIETDLVDPELGIVPDTTLSMTEPIVQVEEGEPDIYATEEEIEGSGPEPIIVEESFRLPEDRNVVVSKGDQIFVIGHAVNERTPKFTESAYKRAFRSLLEAKNIRGKISFKKSEGLKRCALVGRSLLLEVAKDWRIPGTDVILEAHDIVQIVSMKPVVEKACKKESDDEDDDSSSNVETTEEKRAKKEMFLAQKRYQAAKARREASKKNCSDDSTEDELSEEDRKKTESFLRRQGIHI